MAKGADTSTEIKAYIGEETEFKGLLTFSGTVRMDGKLEGEIQSNDTLVVGETGVIQADIAVGTVICKGKITGTIKAKNRVEIHANSTVTGDIETPSLFIEIGAVFEGNCKMGSVTSNVVPMMKGDEAEKTGTETL